MKKDILDKIIILETYNHVIKHLDTLLEEEYDPNITREVFYKHYVTNLWNSEFSLMEREISAEQDPLRKKQLTTKLISSVEAMIYAIDEKTRNDEEILQMFNGDKQALEAAINRVRAAYHQKISQLLSNLKNSSTTTQLQTSGSSTTTPEPRSWIQNLGSNLKDFITNRTTIISLGVVLFSLIAYYFWKRYRRDRCEGLSGNELKRCKLQAINQAILGVRSQIKNCKTQSDPKKCVQDAKKIMKEWEAKKRMI